jgi:hypothetical protein
MKIGEFSFAKTLEATMLHMPHVASRSATGVFDAPANKANPNVETPSARSIAVIKRIAKVLLTMIAFALVVTAIVALKSWIWIPHLAR